MKRLGILGGTFNPPHLAHLIAGERAVDEFALDRLLFIPANIPPHKVGHEMASAEDRLAMTRIAIQGNPRFEVSDMEITRAGKSYTIDTIRALKEIYKPDSIVLFIGLDMFHIFDSWHESEAILREAEVVVMARPTHDVEAIDSESKGQVKFLTLPLLEISSTDIRERVRLGKTIRYLVPDAVGAYIAEHKLYR